MKLNVANKTKTLTNLSCKSGAVNDPKSISSILDISEISKDIDDSELMRCCLSKPGDKFGQWNDKFIILTPYYFHVYTDNTYSITAYDASFKLESITTEFFKHEVSKNRYVMSFHKNGRDERFSTKNQDSYKQLKSFLKKVTIQKNFATKYEVKSKISEGSFACVYETVHKKKLDKRFAAKIYKIDEYGKCEDERIILRYCVKEEIDLLKKVRNTKGLLNLHEVYDSGKELI